MKRNLISELQQRLRSTFLKYRAPCAAARSLAADGRSPPHGPPTAASPALPGAAPPPSAPAEPHVVPHTSQHGIAQTKFLGNRADRATARSHQVNRLSLVVVGKRPPSTSFHPTPPGSPSLLQVSINSEEDQFGIQLWGRSRKRSALKSCHRRVGARQGLSQKIRRRARSTV